MGKRISVTSETKTGRNNTFRDNVTGTTMTRALIVSALRIRSNSLM